MNQETIEQAARAIHLEDWEPGASEWDKIGNFRQETYRRKSEAAFAAIHPTVTSVEELDALPSGSVVLCAGGKTGEGDGDQALIAGPGWAGRPRIFSNYRLKIVPEAMVNDYERITVLHFGGAA